MPKLNSENRYEFKLKKGHTVEALRTCVDQFEDAAIEVLGGRTPKTAFISTPGRLSNDALEKLESDGFVATNSNRLHNELDRDVA